MVKFKLHDGHSLVLAGVVIFSMVLTACSAGGTASQTSTPAATSSLTPSVTVNDQSVASGSVTIADVVSSGPGWIAIQANDNGKPGAVLGDTAVKDGDNVNVVVKIDPLKATPVMYAVLYSDVGKVGTFEPEGPDTPQTVGGQPVEPIFNVTGGLPSPTVTATPGPTPTGVAVVQVYQNTSTGSYLSTQKGLALYYWNHDSPGVSYCTGVCQDTWPPYLTNGTPKSGDPSQMTGTLGVLVLPDGRQQVTYNGYPLYMNINDKNPGDTKGQGVDGRYVMPPGGIPTPTPTASPTSPTPAETETPTP